MNVFELSLRCAVLSHSVMFDSLWAQWRVVCQAPLSMGIFPRKVSGLPFPPPGDLLNPGIKPRSHALWVDSLLFEPPGKPENTGVGSLSLLQGIFLTQELSRGLLHCRQVLYQLSYQGSLIGNVCPHKHLDITIHSSIIHNSPKV